MKLEVINYSHQGASLVSKLYINGEFACYGLEDWDTGVEHRVERGEYPVVLRKEGSVHELYSKKFPEMHKGCLHILVPGRRWILIHIGNSEIDTMGCYLVGSSNNANGKIENSTMAYKRIYPKIADAILKGEEVTIEYYPIETK